METNNENYTEKDGKYYVKFDAEKIAKDAKKFEQKDPEINWVGVIIGLIAVGYGLYVLITI
jgi:hypothetical protein